MQTTAEPEHTTAKKEFETLAGDVRNYIDTSVELYKLKLTAKSAYMASDLTIGLLLVIFSVLTLVFGSIALALFIGNKMQNPYAGFLIVCGGYFVIAIALFLSRDKWLRTSLADRFVKSLHTP